MDDEKLGGREVGGSNHFSFRIKGKLGERADELIKRIEASPLTELIQKYLDAAEEARENKKLSPEDSLKKLIPPLHKVQRIFFPNYPKHYTWNQGEKKPAEEDIIPFANDSYIQCIEIPSLDSKQEIDFEKLEPDPQKYSVLEDTEFKKFGRIYTHNRNIWLSEEYEWYLTYCRDIKPISEADFKRMLETKEIDLTEIIHIPSSKWNWIPKEKIAPPRSWKSISEIWPVWLLTLNQESIKNKDLLTQILVCYTIKRALNGDEKAIKKLCGLYKNAALGVAGIAANKFRRLRSIEEMKGDAEYFLELIIGGFRPERILYELLSDRGDRTIKAIPRWIKQFFVSYLSEWVPKKLAEIQKKAELIKLGEAMGITRDRWKVDLDLGLEIEVLLNPYTPIQDGKVWKENRFNTYSYRPKKMGPRFNLTTWLFGVFEGDPRGNLYRLLRDKYYKRNRSKKFKEEKHRKDLEDGEDVNSDIESGKNFRDEEKELISEIDGSRMLHGLRQKLSGLGASDGRKVSLEQKIDIFLCWKLDRLTQLEIAREYSLSKRQIIRICKEIEKLLPKVKHSFLKEYPLS